MALAFKVSRPDFLSALALLQNVASKKSTLAVLANILLEVDQEGLLLTATDLEVGIRCRIPAAVSSPGAITLPAKKLFEIVKESEEDQISLGGDENFWVKISSQHSDYRLAGTGADLFPEFPAYQENKMVELDSQLLRSLLDRTIYAVAQEGGSDFNLTGLLLEKELKADGHFLRLVATDGHRLALMEGKVDKDLNDLDMDRTVLLPKKGAQELRKLCEEGDNTVFLGIEEKQLVVKSGFFISVIRLMTNDFPSYQGIVQTTSQARCLHISRRKLMMSLKRINTFIEDNRAVSFAIANNKIIISSSNLDYGSAKEEISVAYEGEPITMGFNGRYFYESIQLMESDNVRIYINSTENPCIIKGDNDHGYVSVIMPMKL